MNKRHDVCLHGAHRLVGETKRQTTGLLGTSQVLTHKHSIQAGGAGRTFQGMWWNMNSVMILKVIVADIIETTCQPQRQDYHVGEHCWQNMMEVCHLESGDELTAFCDAAKCCTEEPTEFSGNKWAAVLPMIFPNKKGRQRINEWLPWAPVASKEWVGGAEKCHWVFIHSPCS